MRRLFIPLLAVAACLFGCKDQYDPVVSPAQGVKTLKTFHGVVFQSAAAGIARMGIDGSDVQTIVSNPSSGSNELLGVGKNRLLYRLYSIQSGDHPGLYAIDLDGADNVLIREQVADTNGVPHVNDDVAISRDGDRVAFFTVGLDASDAGGPSYDNGHVYLHVVDSHDPSQQISMTRIDLPSPAELKFSPDGTHLVFTTYGVGSVNLVTIAVDGTGLGIAASIANGAFPEWSPDGTRLACGSGGGVHIVDVATGTTITYPVVDQIPTFFRVAWSPDNTRIAFMKETSSVGAGIQMQIEAMDVASGSTASLTSLNDFYVQGAQWLPDGAKLLVTGMLKSVGGSRGDLGVFDIQSGDVSWITTGGVSASSLIPE